VAAFALCLGGIVGFAFGLAEHQTESNLASHGIHVTGNVTYTEIRHTSSTSTRRQGPSQDDFFLYVDYSAAGQVIHHIFECSLWALDTHPQGSTVEVIYDPSNPAVAILGGNLNATSSAWVFYGSGLAFAIGVLLALYIRLNYRQLDAEYDGGPGDDPPPSESPAGHWSNDPLSEENPGDIPTR